MSDENAEKAISDVSHALEMWFGSQLAEWPDNPTKYFGTPAREAVMAGRASRDAEVERLQAEVKSLRANWENECGNLEMADRKVESLRQQLAGSEHDRLLGEKKLAKTQDELAEAREFEENENRIAGMLPEEYDRDEAQSAIIEQFVRNALGWRQQLADAAEYLAGVKEADDSELQHRDEVEIPALRQQLAERDAELEQVREYWLTGPTGVNDFHVNGFPNRLAQLGDLFDEDAEKFMRGILDTAPASTLDALIREKQAEALEEAADAFRPIWAWVRQMLNERAAEYRNGADHE